jgi:ADP-heptose:LPS heptosyltransferase
LHRSLRKTPTELKSELIPAILVSRQLGGIGDLLMLTPTICQIKQENPAIPLIVCTTSRYGAKGVLFDILRYNPYVDKTIGVNELINYNFKKFYNFGSGKEVQIETETSKNRIDIFAELGEVELKDKQTVYIVSGIEKQWAKKWIEEKIPSSRRKLIGIQVHTSTAKRNWPNEKSLLLAFQIVNTWKDTSVLLFHEGLVSNESVYNNIYSIVKHPIRRVAALINECDGFVALDSGLLHIAGALQKKTVALFGSIKPESRISYYPNAHGIYLYYPCSPCFYSQCKDHYECMSEISVDSVIDKIGELLNRKISVTKKNNILVIRMGGIGDLVMLSSALKQLKKDNPKKDISLATIPNHIPLMEGVSYLKDVFSISDIPKKGHFDKVIDLRYAVEPPQIGPGKLSWNLYTNKNRVDNFETLVGVKSEKKDFEVFLDKEAKKRVKGLTKGLGKFIAVQSVITSIYRTLPPEYIEPLCDLIIKKLKVPVVLFGKAEADGLWWCTGKEGTPNILEIKKKGVLNLIDKLDLKEMVALISIANVVVGPDSGAVHLAGAFKKKCVAVFGNIDPYTRTLYYPTVTNLYPKGELDCIPCWDVAGECKNLSRKTKIGPTAGSECMRLLTPDRILDVIKEVLN